jgi:dipeptidyl aminopeptidase/acylaminoacyl peptidase
MDNNITFSRSLFFILLILLPISQAVAEEQNVLTPGIVVNLEVVTDAAISPDGATVAYVRRVQRSPDESRGSAYTELFIVPTTGGKPQQFTFRPHTVADIRWSPDNEYIYFRSSRPEIQSGIQVYRIPAHGGEAEIVTRAASSVLSFTLSPDGGKLAYILQDPEPEAVRERKAAGDDWTVADEYYRHRRVHVMDLASGESGIVTSFDLSVWDFVWTPDGSAMVVQASPLPETDHRYMFKKMYLVNAAGCETPEIFVDTQGKLGGMAFSPDGRHLAWHGAVDINDPTEGTLFVANSQTREMWEVVPGFEGTVTDVKWVDNNTLAFISEEETWTRMSTVSFRGGTRTVLFDEKDYPEFTSLRLAEDGRTFVAVASAYRHPNEVYTGDLSKREMRRITFHNPELTGMEFNDYEFIEYEARDGLRITGLLLKPLDYREGERYPLICQIHGGPEAAYTHGWNTGYSVMTQLYSHKGYMVFLPNYRASTGRGVGYAKANHGDGGGKEFTDVIDGVEYLNERGLIDRTRVGIVGGSYGGYFANLAATRYAGNFTAAVSFVGVTNQFSKTGLTDTPMENILVHFTRAHYQDEHRVGIMEASPIWYLEQAVQPENETPLLIIHGEQDARVPYGQSVELYRGLMLSYKHHRGMTRDEVPVTFISYPRAGHGTGEVRQQLHFSHTVLEFFEKYLRQEGFAEHTER